MLIELWLPSNWAAGSQPSLTHWLSDPPQTPVRAGRHSGDSKTKIDLSCPENFQNYNILENGARDTRPVPWVQLGMVHKPSWKCPHSRPGSHCRARHRVILCCHHLTTPLSPVASHHCPPQAPGLACKTLIVLTLPLPLHASATNSP